jgi:hypothetical protein
MVDEVIVEEAKVEVVLAAPELVKEEGRYFQKTEVSVAALIEEQNKVIAVLEEQKARAEATIAELSAKL